ncbi:hypothetical protein GALL_432170 [mine drainage metagenome]|uniref:Uncharacterized protein n=1 Tax=mine drainage metagenome TaxID=410659 RepID=A0A1J5Q557_9ZZZZ
MPRVHPQGNSLMTPVPIRLAPEPEPVVEALGCRHRVERRQDHGAGAEGDGLAHARPHQRLGDATPPGLGRDSEHPQLDLARPGHLRVRRAGRCERDRADDDVLARGGEHRDEQRRLPCTAGCVAELIRILVVVVDQAIRVVGLCGERTGRRDLRVGRSRSHHHGCVVRAWCVSHDPPGETVHRTSIDVRASALTEPALRVPPRGASRTPPH